MQEQRQRDVPRLQGMPPTVYSTLRASVELQVAVTKRCFIQTLLQGTGRNKANGNVFERYKCVPWFISSSTA